MINTNTTIPISLNSQDVSATSMYGLYFTQSGQSIYDVCLQLYGTLDELVSMMALNQIGGLSDSNIQGHSIIFEMAKRQDSLLGRNNFQNNITYATLYVNALPITFSYELREEGGYELREDGGYELR